MHRSKPAVPFGGKHRIIDIPLSNCINSGFRNIYIVTQFNSASAQFSGDGDGVGGLAAAVEADDRLEDSLVFRLVEVAAAQHLNHVSLLRFLFFQ